MQERKIYFFENDDDDASCDECLKTGTLVYFEESEFFLCHDCLAQAYQLINEG